MYGEIIKTINIHPLFKDYKKSISLKKSNEVFGKIFSCKVVLYYFVTYVWFDKHMGKFSDFKTVYITTILTQVK